MNITRVLHVGRLVGWLLLGALGGFLVLCKPKVILPREPLTPGSHILGVSGGPLGPLFRHRLEFAVRSEQLGDMDILVTSRIGHARIETSDAVLLPVFFKDRVVFNIGATENAQVDLAHVGVRRTLLPGGWLVLIGAGASVLFVHWLARKPVTREKLIKGALFVGSSAAGFLLCTVGLEVVRPRSLNDQEWRLFPPHLNQTFRVLPDVTPGIPAGLVQFRTNSEGIRARERGEHFADTFSVLSIGASTTEGLFLGEENHWPRVLEKRLQQSKGTNVWVGNAGHSGFSTAKLVVVASNYVPRIKPKVVIVLTGFNEGLVPETVEESRSPESNPSLGESIKGTLLRLRITRLIKKALFNYHDRSPNDMDMSGDTSAYELFRRKLQEQARRYPPRERIWDDLDLSSFEKALQELHALCKRSGTRLILCTQPTLYRVDLGPDEQRLLWMMGNYTPASKRRRMDLVNDRLRQVAKELTVELVDLDRELPRTIEIFYDDCHFNVEGARRVADLIFNQCFP